MNDILDLKKARKRKTMHGDSSTSKTSRKCDLGKRNDYMNGFFHLKEKDYPLKSGKATFTTSSSNMEREFTSSKQSVPSFAVPISPLQTSIFIPAQLSLKMTS